MEIVVAVLVVAVLGGIVYQVIKGRKDKDVNQGSGGSSVDDRKIDKH